ncbi:MAG: DUF2452 domain-containing protein [Halieaceae bacterium]|nr:DUF2452 domain-containing protein [Halieaceae bacterium]
MPDNPNPQGKGLTPVLEEWRGVQPARVSAKTPRQVLADYFTTLLVISAEFSFKPAPGIDYYLYLRNGGWLLSLISPGEWRGRAPGPCLGRCELQTDMTWSLAPEAGIEEDPALVEALAAFQAGFIELLDSDTALEESLPYYVAQLPYYRRLLAAGLAKSLNTSLALAGLTGHSGKTWLEQSPLPRLT